jgi:hypothetical protein
LTVHGHGDDRPGCIGYIEGHLVASNG